MPLQYISLNAQHTAKLHTVLECFFSVSVGVFPEGILLYLFIYNLPLYVVGFGCFDLNDACLKHP